MTDMDEDMREDAMSVTITFSALVLDIRMDIVEDIRAETPQER